MLEARQIFLDLPWEDKNFYANWLAQSYYFLCHATRLLCVAGARFDVHENEPLHLRCLEHSRQEMRHEKLAMKDLKELGFPISDFAQLPMAAQLYQSQYYLIEHEDPCAIFGSVLYLEGLSVGVGKEIYRRVKAAHGDECASFLRVHVNEDIGHIEEAFQSLNGLNGKQLASVAWSLVQNHAIYTQMLAEIVKVSIGKTREMVA
jgi:thiaminase